MVVFEKCDQYKDLLKSFSDNLRAAQEEQRYWWSIIRKMRNDNNQKAVFNEWFRNQPSQKQEEVKKEYEKLEWKYKCMNVPMPHAIALMQMLERFERKAMKAVRVFESRVGHLIYFGPSYFQYEIDTNWIVDACGLKYRSNHNFEEPCEEK